jgi:very-short-patch-repair endonuclease
MRAKPDTPDARIARMASRQHGVVSTRQLLAIGLSRSGIARRAAIGRLHRLHRGVYAVGHLADSNEMRWMAAVLAYGAGPTSADVAKGGRLLTPLRLWGAALSHRSAAMLWCLMDPTTGPADVSVPGSAGKEKREGIRLHRSKSLTSQLVTTRLGIPVTIPARTITDLAAGGKSRSGGTTPRELRRAIRRAEVLGLKTEAEAYTERTRSDLELAFLHLCRRNGLPEPEVNVWIGSLEVDFLWRRQRLIVETDHYRYHRGRAAFRNDHSRDLELIGLGYAVVRLSEEQVDEEPERVVEVLLDAIRG